MSVICAIADPSIYDQGHHQVLHSLVEVPISIILNYGSYCISNSDLLSYLIVHKLPQNVTGIDNWSSSYTCTHAYQNVVQVCTLTSLLQILSDIIVDSLYGEDATHHDYVTFPEAIETFCFVDSFGAVPDGLIQGGNSTKLEQLYIVDHSHFDDLCWGSYCCYTAHSCCFDKYRIEHN